MPECPKCGSLMLQDYDKQSWLCTRSPFCDGRFYEPYNEEAEKKRIVETYGVKEEFIQVNFKCGHAELVTTRGNAHKTKKNCTACAAIIQKEAEKRWREKKQREKGGDEGYGTAET